MDDVIKDTAALPSAREIIRAPMGYGRQLAARVRARWAEPQGRLAAAPLLAIVGVLLAMLGYWTVMVIQVPSVDDLRALHVAEATIAYTADGEELTRYHFENRTWVTLDSVALPAVQAIIAIEDHRFYDHGGVDPWRIFGAVLGTAGGEKQGGSTLTMQLARNTFPSIRDDFILSRKIKEWLTAARIEDRYAKAEVLEFYLNAVPFLYDAVGIEAAAKTYFSKPASALTTPEAATLAAMLKATSSYNPVRFPERSFVRRNAVLQRMVDVGFLEAAEYQAMMDTPTKLAFNRLTRQNNLAPYFAEQVRQWLDDWADDNGYNLYTDGLRVYTTLDSRLQQAAEAAVDSLMDDMQAVVDVEWSQAGIPFRSSRAASYQKTRAKITPFAYFWRTNQDLVDELLQQTPRFRRLVGGGASSKAALSTLQADTSFVDSLKTAAQRLETGFVALDPTTGYVKAWVGGRDFRGDEYDHVSLARRQPGSTFKPFVYAAALENGYAPYSGVVDRPVNYVDPHTKKRWSPKNFGGGSGGAMTLRQGLAYSKNTISAQLIISVGPEKVADMARRMGIQSELLAVPSLALGTSEVTLLEMANAYATLASLGVRREPILVTRIEDRDGNMLEVFESDTTHAVSPHIAYGVLDMMRGVVQYGTAVRFRSMFGGRGDLAGKTGTTQNGADGWFMLIHPRLVAGAWMGFNSPSINFRTRYWGQGSHSALHVVGNFYRNARAYNTEFLDTKAKFEEAPAHQWKTKSRLSPTDIRNRQARQRTNLGKYLKQRQQQLQQLENQE